MTSGCLRRAAFLPVAFALGCDPYGSGTSTPLDQTQYCVVSHGMHEVYANDYHAMQPNVLGPVEIVHFDGASIVSTMQYEVATYGEDGVTFVGLAAPEVRLEATSATVGIYTYTYSGACTHKRAALGVAGMFLLEAQMMQTAQMN